MHKVIVLIHTMLVVAYMPPWPLIKASILKGCPYKPPPLDHNGGMHFSRQVGAMTNLNLLQEIAKL